MTDHQRKRAKKLADAYGLKVNKHRQERMLTNYVTGEPRPWLDRPDSATKAAYLFGYEAALKDAEVLVEALEREIHRCGSWREGSKALAKWRGE